MIWEISPPAVKSYLPVGGREGGGGGEVVDGTGDKNWHRRITAYE